MKTIRRSAALILALSLIFTLAGCAKAGDGPNTDASNSTNGSTDPGPDKPDPGPGDTSNKDETDPSTPSTSDDSGDPTSSDGSDDPGRPDDPEIPTPGKNALKLGLCADAAAIGAAGLVYNDAYALVTGTQDLTAAFTAGELDAALVPFDAAARIYASSGGKVKLAAVTASGGWKIVERGTVVRDIYALMGKTVYVPQESAMAVKLFENVAERYGFVLGETLFIEGVPTSTLSEYDLALMPAILAGSLIVKDADTRLALDLGTELENISGLSLLPVGCLIVSSGMEDAKAEKLLQDLKTSQDSVSENLDAAVALKLAASQEEAWAAANDSCRFVWYTGEEMRDQLDGFIDLLYSLDPSLLGGHIPDDGFYR